jgi:hypothetical protein
MQNIVGTIWMASRVPAIIAKSSKKGSFEKAHRLQPVLDSMNSIQIDKLKALSDQRLQEVVRDWQVHGYDEETRQIAITILAERGITAEDLKLNGYWTNREHSAWKSRAKSASQIGVSIVVFYIFLRLLLPLILRFVPEGFNFEITVAVWVLAIGFIALQVYWVLMKSK